MAKNIRSKYIKNLVSESKGIDKGFDELTKQTLKDLLKETVNAEFRSIINESDEDFDEEEVNPAEEPVAGSEMPDTEKPEGDAPEEDLESAKDAADIMIQGSAAEPAEIGDNENPEEKAVWDSLEQYKDESGEYDLTGMDGEEVVKVLKVMKPEDGIRVVKNGSGTLKLTDEENDVEYVIDLEPEDDEDTFEIEVDECGGACAAGGDDTIELHEDDNTGYTDNYQKKTAMTTPDNHEPSPMKGYRDWDKGAPRGTKKPWAGKGDSQPFNESDEKLYEIELDDLDNSGNESAMTMSNKRTNREPNGEDNGHDRKRRHRNRTGVSPTMNGSDEIANEAIKRKANQIFIENKQLKEVAGKIKDRLEESYLTNYNLGKIVKIITENATTRDEKIAIVNRFSEVKSIEESKRLYETITKELSSTKATSNVDNVLNGNINEGRQWTPDVVETAMYRSEDLHETLDLMERMDRIGRK